MIIQSSTSQQTTIAGVIHSWDTDDPRNEKAASTYEDNDLRYRWTPHAVTFLCGETREGTWYATELDQPCFRCLVVARANRE